MLKLVLVFAMLAPKPVHVHWVKVHNSLKHHVRLVNYNKPRGNWIGEYYQTSDPDNFTAQCYEGAPQGFDTELEARAYVASCPRWK